MKELVHTVRDRADEFGIDADRFAIWVCSGGAPFVLPWIIRERPEYIRCAAALYTRLDLRDPTPSEVQTARTANTFSPLKSLEVAQRPVLPMLLVRAGLDQPELNGSIDRFVAAALARNEDIELVNYSGGHHTFDIIDDTGRSRQIITRIVEFFRINLMLSIMSP